MDSTGGKTVALVDDDDEARALVRLHLRRHGYEATEYRSGESFLAALEDEPIPPACVVLDMMMPGMSGLDVLRQLRADGVGLAVIVVTASSDVTIAIEAMKLGAIDYHTKPFEFPRLLHSIEAAIERSQLRTTVARLQREVRTRYRFDDMIGESPAMQALQQEIDKVAATNIPVYVLGESGSGKELVARAIHYRSARADGPFVELNCAAIPETLLESELFGHEKGAFTDAAARHIGRFEQANGGTIFLDEVAELSPSAQAKLLRTIQEREVQRLGSTKTVKLDVRLIAATHQDLEARVQAGEFREDLYYRLVVYTINVPPLRDRLSDLPFLIQHFVQHYASEVGRTFEGVAPRALELLTSYRWPGNVRELSNVVYRAMISASGAKIDTDALPRKLVSAATSGSIQEPTLQSGDASEIADSGVVVPLTEVERRAIQQALRVCGGNVTQAAAALQIGRSTLYRKLAEYDLI